MRLVLDLAGHPNGSILGASNTVHRVSARGGGTLTQIMVALPNIHYEANVTLKRL